MTTIKNSETNIPQTDSTVKSHINNTILNQQKQQKTETKSFLNQVNDQIDAVSNKYKEYKRKKQQKLFTLPQAKVYPSKPHKMEVQELRKLNFSKLSQEELKILDDLSTFTPHLQFVKMMNNRHSDIKKKQHFIKQHSTILSTDQFGQFNRAKFQYEKNSMTFAAFCTGTLTLSGFMIGLWVLPARKTPWKYTLIGFGLGLGISYGFWRMQIFQYHNKMNDQFKSIMREKYQNQKKSQKLKASRLE